MNWLNIGESRRIDGFVVDEPATNKLGPLEFIVIDDKISTELSSTLLNQCY